MKRTIQVWLYLMGVLGGAMALAGPVDVNSADAETISAELTGVGLSRATAIVEYRKENGPFKSVDELLNVKGIGERTLELNENNIRITKTAAKTGK